MKTKNLTLAEAHASGRKYRRANYYLEEFQKPELDVSMPIEDAIATDYELEPQAKLLTREEVEEAFYMALPVTKHEESKHITVMLARLFGAEDV
jgi:hypothetical protein